MEHSMNKSETEPKQPALPATYSAAKAAIAKCVRLEEVKTLADQAAAITIYAKISNDESLENDTKRIRARAARRGGELLIQVPTAQGQRTDKLQGGAPPKLSREAVAKKAGLSKDQAKQMIRVANVPEGEFERQVESDKPPTVQALAKQGTTKRPQTPGKPQTSQEPQPSPEPPPADPAANTAPEPAPANAQEPQTAGEASAINETPDATAWGAAQTDGWRETATAEQPPADGPAPAPSIAPQQQPIAPQEPQEPQEDEERASVFAYDDHARAFREAVTTEAGQKAMLSLVTRIMEFKAGTRSAVTEVIKIDNLLRENPEFVNNQRVGMIELTLKSALDDLTKTLNRFASTTKDRRDPAAPTDADAATAGSAHNVTSKAATFLDHVTPAADKYKTWLKTDPSDDMLESARADVRRARDALTDLLHIQTPREQAEQQAARDAYEAERKAEEAERAAARARCEAEEAARQKEYAEQEAKHAALKDRFRHIPLADLKPFHKQPDEDHDYFELTDKEGLATLLGEPVCDDIEEAIGDLLYEPIDAAEAAKREEERIANLKKEAASPANVKAKSRREAERDAYRDAKDDDPDLRRNEWEWSEDEQQVWESEFDERWLGNHALNFPASKYSQKAKAEAA
jgi:hypothetical protein